MKSRVAWGLAMLCAGREVRAQAVDAPLTWEAPPTCPDGAEVQRRMAAQRAPASPGRPSRLLRARATVTHDAAWSLHLAIETRTGTGERTLTGASCAEVAEAAALILALAYDETDATPEPPPPVASAPTEPPATTAPPAPTPTVATPPRPVAAPSRSRAARLFVRADGVLDVGTLPAWSPGAAVSVGLSRDRWRVELAGVLLASQRAEVTPGLGGDIGLVAGVLRGCFAVAQGRASLDACLAFEGGHLSGQGFGVVDAQRDGGARWAARAGVAVRVRVTSGVRFRAALEPGITASAPTFVVANAGVVYAPSVVFGQLSAGLEAGD